MTRMDINEDDFLSREDYNCMAKQLAEYSRFTENKLTQHTVADTLNLKPGFKRPLQEAIQRASMSLLSMPPKEWKEKITIEFWG